MDETFRGRLDRLNISLEDFAKRLGVDYEEIVSWGKSWGHAAPKYAVALLDCLETQRNDVAAINAKLDELEELPFFQRQAD